ncbi:unnamed protein product [Camellia sinensis]
MEQIDKEELLELVELDVPKLLSSYEFPGDDVPIVSGSALLALDALMRGRIKAGDNAAIVGHSPFLAGYRPQFYMRTTDVARRMASIMNDKDEESKMVMPGDHVKMVVELIMPAAYEQGMRFAIREGGKTLGAGVIQSIVE